MTLVFSDTGPEHTRLYEVAPEASFRLVQTATGVGIRVHAGPVADFWTVLGESTTELGGQLALSVEVPLATRVHLVVRGSGVLTTSVFEQKDLPSQVQAESMRRGTIGLGVRYGP